MRVEITACLEYISISLGLVEHLQEPHIFPPVEVKILDKTIKIRSFSLNWLPNHLKQIIVQPNLLKGEKS